ncbi:hypothetical protein AB0D29_25690 [Streptomyces sp. NPDC048424]|uniref:hypothetical protein n=1 Tax=Streptomyces sp. NPDC048424 TaxID=3155265 RepID=UPI003427E7E3
MSCGNHTAEFRAASRRRTDPNLTKAARRWAEDEGVEVKNNGALDARVLASYQLQLPV